MELGFDMWVADASFLFGPIDHRAGLAHVLEARPRHGTTPVPARPGPVYLRAGPGRVPGPILVLRAGPWASGLMENYTPGAP